MSFLNQARRRFRDARQRQYSKLARRLNSYVEKHPGGMPPQQLPEGGLFIQYEGEPEPRAYSSAVTHPSPEKDAS